MSIISVTVDEQNLHITDSPKIAAQGVNENYIEFTFDSTWTGFAKVALFYREEDEDTVYQSIIDENSLALIPHEVTDQDGKICFGVAGVKDDKIFTTEILTYKIVKGLYVSGEGTTPPTPGIYEQMLALAQQIVNNEADFEDEITARVDNLAAHYNVEYGSVELWSGSASGADTTGNLSQAADAFDYLDIYVLRGDMTHIKTVKPVFNEVIPPLVPYFDVGIVITEANSDLIVSQMRLRFTKSNNASGFVIVRQGYFIWTGDSADSAAWENTPNFVITKIVGRKIYENAEVIDIRVGADGTVYDSAGTAVRSQIEAGGSGGGGLTAEIKTALLNLLSHVAYIDENGGTYYDALATALNGINSISAAFNQGANVIYDTDSLDTLKQYLVVTANYSDGTSSVVTTYTLSGSLTAGTSTITATYQGEIDTFSVTVAGVTMPSGYTRYDYIKSTVGNGNRAKATWIILNDQTNLSALKTRIILAKSSNPGADSAFLGVRNDSGAETSYGFYLTKEADGGGVAVWLNGVKTYSSDGFTTGLNRNILEVDPKTSSPGSITLNGESASISYTSTVTIPHGFVLFTNPKYDGSVNMSLTTPAIIGDIVLTDFSGNIVGYYVPAVYNGRIGMYDGVSQQFYTSSTAAYTTIGNSNCLYAVGNWS